MADISYLTLMYEDFQMLQIIDPDKFDKNYLDIKNKINEMITPLNTNVNGLNTHKASGDHDTRYYSKTDIDTVILPKYYTKLEIDSNFFNLNGNQTISGVKTFTSNPIVNTPINPNEVSNKGYVDTTIGSVVLGQISDGSLDDIKLSNDSGMIKSRVNILNTINITSGTSPNFLVSNPDIVNLYEGLKVTLKFHEQSTTISTIRFNNFNVKGLKKPNGNDLTNIPINSIMTFVFDGVNFTLQGEGGEYGTATPSEVMTGYTIGTDDGLVNGTIPSKTAQTYTPSTVNQTIASGQYLSGVQTILGDADLVSSKIPVGVNLFNVAGTYTSDATAIASEIANWKTAYVNGAKLTGTSTAKKYAEGYFQATYNGASKVIITVTGLSFTPSKVILNMTRVGYYNYQYFLISDPITTNLLNNTIIYMNPSVDMSSNITYTISLYSGGFTITTNQYWGMSVQHNWQAFE